VIVVVGGPATGRARRPPAGPRLWTIGYEGRAQHDVITLLDEAGVELLVDVRFRPQSRKPGLSRTALSAALQDAGIAYDHRRDLGTPPPIRSEFKAGNLEAARASYREWLLATAAVHLEQLAVDLQDRRTALLCFELDPRRCHRRVIAEQLVRAVPALVVVDL
jgi:uncharacterized protein (DUF488 family)